MRYWFINTAVTLNSGTWTSRNGKKMWWKYRNWIMCTMAMVENKNTRAISQKWIRNVGIQEGELKWHKDKLIYNKKILTFSWCCEICEQISAIYVIIFHAKKKKECFQKLYTVPGFDLKWLHSFFCVPLSSKTLAQTTILHTLL